MTIDHLSYSSLTAFECPRNYYLSHVKKAWPVPAWYFIVGSTVHDMIEKKLLGHGTDTTAADPSPALEEIFMHRVSEAMELEPDTSKWLHGGSKEDPVVEERALKLALDCYENAVNFLEDMEVWHVEYDATGYLPGCVLPIKAYIDIIGEHRKHGPVILDWKTGKTKPKGQLQLETYDKLYCLKENARKFKGLYVMLNPDAAQARPVEFTLTPEDLGKIYHDVEIQIEKKIARTNHGFMCKFCTMAPNCKLQSGKNERTLYYDTPEEDGWYPF